MGILSLIIIFICMIIFFKKDKIKNKFLNLVLLVIVIEILNPSGNFLKIGNMGIGYKYVVEFLLFIFDIYIVCKIRINKKIFLFSIAFLISILIGLLLEVIFPYDGYIINFSNKLSWDGYVLGLTNKEHIKIDYAWFLLLYLKCVIYMVTTCIVKTILDKEDIIYLLNKTIIYTRFIIYYGFLEYIIVNIFGKHDIIKYIQMAFLGDYKDITIRGDNYGLVGITNEPSWFVISLFTLVVLRILINKIYENKFYEKKRKLNNIEIFFIILLMFLTGGFSCIWYTGVIIVLYFFSKKMEEKSFSLKNIIKKVIYLIICIGFFYIIYIIFLENQDNYFSERINITIEVFNYLINNEMLIYASSTASRLISIYDVTCDFFNRPFFGLGLGIQTSHGGVATFLSDFGMIGTYLFVKVILFNKLKNVKYDKYFLIIYLIISNIAMGLRGLGLEIYFIIIIESSALYYKGKR